MRRIVFLSGLAENREKLARTTYDRYLDTLEKVLYPEYGNTPMKDMTEDKMNRFLADATQKAVGKRGSVLKTSSLHVVKAVITNVSQYAYEVEYGAKADIVYDRNPYVELCHSDIARICLRARMNHTMEFLSALLALFCGMRIGELCGLSSDDVDIDRMQVYIHSTAHRVRNLDENAKTKSIVIVEEMPRKMHIRRVHIPAVLRGYIGEFVMPGRPLLRAKDGKSPVDPRTLENRLMRTMKALHLDNVNYERLRMTYMNGKADEVILTNAFLGIRPNHPYTGTIDIPWLTDEMAKDLEPLRLLAGLSCEEMGKILGVSEAVYREMENGRRAISWDEYLAFLFVFHYNGRTMNIVNALGLFPQSLKEKMKIGF